MDTAGIGTLPQLAAALDQLRHDRSLSLQGLADAAARLPPRRGRQPALPRSTASDLLNAKSAPEVETLVTFLAACGIREEKAQRPWLQALDRVANQHHRCPPGAVRVRDARPRMLGVHAAIQIDRPAAPDRSDAAHGDELPPYVWRDFDADLHTKLTRAQHQGGFVLLVGDSSVGKTRALFEAMQAVLPDWWLLHPNDAEALRRFAAHPTGRTIVWLDELQDYLDFAGGVPAGQVRELIASGVVLVATCWPGEHSKRLAFPGDGQPDPYANDRRLLDLADVLHVPAAFSNHERRRAEELAGTDPRIRDALDTPDACFTQVMAAGPDLIRHWTEASAYAQAVITAALDARRVGAHAPLTRDYLAESAPGYLNERRRATAPPAWLDDALNYATQLLHGATAALTPIAASMGTIAGYQVADYLHQHALQARRREPLPGTAWQALIRHHHPDDTRRIAENAELRGRDHVALNLYQQLADDGDEDGAGRLADLLTERGQVEQLGARADNGEEFAAIGLARLLVGWRRVEHLRARADGGDWYAALGLVHLLTEQGQVEEVIEVLRTHADNGNGYAELQLADRLAALGQVEGAIAVLRTRADNGNDYADLQLTDRLAALGQVEGVIEVLRTHADNGDQDAAYRLADLLAERRQVEDAIEILRTYADNGDHRAARRLADLLAEQGQVERLRARADNGDQDATYRLADLLAKHGQVEDAVEILRAHADNGDGYAAYRLADLLAKHGQVEDAVEILRTRPYNVQEQFAYRLADLLAKQGHVESAIKTLRTRADNGDGYAVHRLADLLAKHGQVEDAIETLRTRADNGDQDAARRLADLLAEQGRVDQLRARADDGDTRAAVRLALLLAEQGQVEQLQARADNGDESAAYRLAQLLTEQGHVEDAIQVLRTHADVSGHVALRLAELLTERGQIEDAIQVLRARLDNGDDEAVLAAHRLAHLLTKQGQIEDAIQLMRTHADNGDKSAAAELVALLDKLGRVDELEREVAAGTAGAVAALRLVRSAGTTPAIDS